MKQLELDKKIAEIRKQIEKSNLVDMCEEISLLGEATTMNHRDASTHSIWEYSGENIQVFYENGRYHFGNGKELKVSYENKLVFHVVDSQAYKDFVTNCPFIELKDGGIVLEYQAGLWEQEIREALKEVSNAELDRYSKNFGVSVE